MKIEVLPTLLVKSADVAHERLSLLDAHTAWIQIDVVDGVFARNTTLEAAAFPSELAKFSVEAQLMVEDPTMYIQDWYQAGAKRIIIHIESSGDIAAHIAVAKKLGLEVLQGSGDKPRDREIRAQGHRGCARRRR